MCRISSPTVLLVAVGLLTLIGTVVTLKVSSYEAAAMAFQSGASLEIDECIEVNEGDTIDLTISISGTPELFAWEIYFAYDRDLIEVVGRDVRLFLSEGSNSNVFDVSDPVPNSTGIYRLGAADVGLDSTAEAGSGELATIAVRAKAKGVSPAAIFKLDTIPLGPRLTGVGGTSIADFDGDGLFDGSIRSGQVAIGVSCDPVAPTPDPDLDIIFPQGSPTITPTGSPASSNATAEPGGTSGPRPSVAPTDGATTGAEPTPSAETDDTGSSASPTADRPVPGGGSSGGGFASGSDNTFWAIVLISGGIGLGLVVTYVVSVATRKTA